MNDNQNNNNDPFKKMDLNFDPTQETKVVVEDKKEEPIIAEPKQEEKVIAEPKQEEKVNKDVLPKTIIEHDLSSVDKEEMNKPIASNEKEKSMDKTLEFIIQNDPINTDLSVDEKAEAKAAEKKARKHRKISFFWVFICLLTIIFGIESIWGYADQLGEFIGDINDFNNPEINASFPIVGLIYLIFNSFEPFLFTFFILLSMVKYQKNHKPWVKWWDDTEPLRVGKEIEKEKEKNIKNLQRFNALGLHNTYTKLESQTQHEELKNWKDENNFLEKKIAEEENRLKEVAKKAKEESKK